MATTSNFGWTTPDDTDLVKDGAAAIRTLGSAIDTSLVDLKGGTTGQVLSKTSNTDMDFTWVAQDDTDAIQSSIIAAKGDLIVGTANDTAGILSVGTDGYTLVADSVETTGLKWVAPAGGGKVLQVVQGTYSTNTTNATNVYADTGLTATITPTLATSKVLVLVSQNGVRKSAGNSGNGAVLKLLRGGTDIALFSGYGGWTGTLLDNYINSVGIDFLDSPATTSATTYKTQFKNDVNAANVSVQNNSEVSTITLLEIGV